MLPPEPRLPGARDLVEQGLYFVVHAPRQTGKTTTLMAMARDITAGGERAAVLFSCERARIYSSEFGAAGRAILQAITEAARNQGLPADCQPPAWPDAPPDSLLTAGLQEWARSCPRPLVLFFDEFDSLTGPALLSVASQLRDGYQSRPGNFPASVALCGLRDIRDYRIAAGQHPEPSGNSTSPFNIIDKSFRMHDFNRAKVAELYGQHTADTGQEFTAGAVDRAFGCTQGQPWLVNALAREITDKNEMGVNRTGEIHAYLSRVVFGTDRVTSVSEDRTKASAIPMFALANLLVVFAPKGLDQWSYLDMIEASIEAVENTNEPVLPSMVYEFCRPKKILVA